jgi:chromosome segregation ATPase
MSDLAVREPMEETLRAECDSLRRKIERIEAELDSTHEALRAARQQSVAANNALKNLRKNLEPMFRALQMVFGELEAASIGGDSTESAATPRALGVWKSWMQKLGGKQAEFIQAMLDHGEVTVAQLKVMTHSGSSTIPQIIYKLNKLGLINKNGGKYSLKEL